MTASLLALDTNCWIYALDDPSSERATWLREQGLRLADAAVLATARLAGARLLTNDASLVSAAGSQALLLDDLLGRSLPRG